MLVVDDDFTVRSLFANAFEVRGINVDVAEDGIEAMRLLRLYPTRYCALVLDLNIPAPDGIRVAQYVQNAIPNLAVVMITGDTDAVERIRNAGLAGTVRLIIPRLAHPSEIVGYVHGQCIRPRESQDDREARA